MKEILLSAGAIVVRRQEEDWFFLMLRVYHYWDFPKGLVEPGEKPIRAARREAEEETGLTDLSFPWGEEYRETPPYGRGKIARYYLAETRQISIELPVSTELGRPEHHEARWFDYAGARSLLGPRLTPVLDWAHDVLSQSRNSAAAEE
jgi:8-oxo-dGTP pyrophosphatase MutT (NUDIX family)